MRLWPNDVPYEQQIAGAVIPQTYRPPTSAPVEAGPNIMRRRPGPRSTIINWKSVDLTPAQWSRLERFFRVDLLEGTLDFDMPVYRPDEGYKVRNVQIQDGLWNTDQNDHPIIWVSFQLVIFNL